KLADVATVAEENIVGVHVVKSFAQEAAEQRKFEDRSEAVFSQSVRANRQRAFYVPLMSFLPLLAQGAVLLVGGRMVVHDTLPLHEFVVFNLLVMMLVMPLRMLGMWIGQAQRATASGERIFQVIDEPDGADVRDVKVRSLRRAIGVVAQDPFLFSATVRENIAFGNPEATDEDVVHAARLAQAHDFVAALPEGYDTVIGERGITLSGGQRQRIAIARALVVDPRVLILDDATASVDATTEARIRLGLREAMRGRTTIIIAHRLSTIALADELVVLEEGRVAA